MLTNFFDTQGLVTVDITPDKAIITATYYTTSVLPKGLPHIQSTARTRRRSWIQLHHDNAAPHKARIIQTYLDHMTIVSVWWNFHHTRPSWLRSISGSFQKSNQLLLGSLFQGSKTLVKLCIQRWGPYLLQSTGNLSEVKDAVPDPLDLEIREIGGGGGG